MPTLINSIVLRSNGPYHLMRFAEFAVFGDKLLVDAGQLLRLRFVAETHVDSFRGGMSNWRINPISVSAQAANAM